MEIEIKTDSTTSARFINYGKDASKVKYLYDKPYKTYNNMLQTIGKLNKLPIEEVHEVYGNEIRLKYEKYLNDCVTVYLKQRLGFLLMTTNYEYSFKKYPYIKEFNSRYSDYYNPEFGGIETIQYDKKLIHLFLNHNQNHYLLMLKTFYDEKTHKDGEHYNDYSELLVDIENRLLDVKMVNVKFTNDNNILEEYEVYFHSYIDNIEERKNIYNQIQVRALDPLN